MWFLLTMALFLPDESIIVISEPFKEEVALLGRRSKVAGMEAAILSGDDVLEG
jgi:hypothetical protein